MSGTVSRDPENLVTNFPATYTTVLSSISHRHSLTGNYTISTQHPRVGGFWVLGCSTLSPVRSVEFCPLLAAALQTSRCCAARIPLPRNSRLPLRFSSWKKPITLQGILPLQVANSPNTPYLFLYLPILCHKICLCQEQSPHHGCSSSIRDLVEASPVFRKGNVFIFKRAEIHNCQV